MTVQYGPTNRLRNKTKKAKIKQGYR